jgi:putative addiction module component (TIGR02574 family)
MSYPTRAEIEQLSPDERLRLIEDIWQTFEVSPEELPLSQEHIALLDDRLARLERNAKDTVSREEMMLQIQNPG